MAGRSGTRGPSGKSRKSGTSGWEANRKRRAQEASQGKLAYLQMAGKWKLPQEPLVPPVPLVPPAPLVPLAPARVERVVCSRSTCKYKERAAEYYNEIKILRKCIREVAGAGPEELAAAISRAKVAANTLCRALGEV